MSLRRLSTRIWQADQREARALCEGLRTAWKKEGIRGVLCAAYNIRITYHASLAALILPIWDDSSPEPPIFDLAVRFHQTYGATLVHCNAGLNRSSAFAAALLMSEGLPLDQALEKTNAIPSMELIGALKAWDRQRKEA